MLKELITIANELDQNSLSKEADYLDSIMLKMSGDDYHSMGGPDELYDLLKDPSEGVAATFVEDWLSPDSKYSWDDPEEELESILQNGSVELNDYIVNAIPEKISIEAEKLHGVSSGELYASISKKLRSLADESEGRDSDQSFIFMMTNALLSRYEWPID